MFPSQTWCGPLSAGQTPAWATLGAVFTGSVLLALGAGLVPALRAARTEPATCLRTD